MMVTQLKFEAGDNKQYKVERDFQQRGILKKV